MAEFDRAALRKIFEGAEIEVPKDVLGKICDLHASCMDDMPDMIKELKTKLKAAERERDEAIEKAPKDGEETVTKAEYERLDNEYKAYKTDIEKRDTKAAKERAVRDYFSSKGILGKNLEIAMRGSHNEIDTIELDNGKIKDSSNLDSLLTDTFSALVGKTETKGAPEITPPVDGNSAPTGKGYAAQRAAAYYDRVYGKEK